MKLSFFEIGEFDSPDEKGSGVNMKRSTLEMLDKARKHAQTPFKITSGFRTKRHNKRVGGTDNSSHLKGYAVDIEALTNQKRESILRGLILAGFKRIGIAETFIHADNDPDKIRSCWMYGKKKVGILNFNKKDKHEDI